MKMLGLCCLIFVTGVFYGSGLQVDVGFTTKNENEISPSYSSSNEGSTKWKQAKELTQSFFDDIDILNSDYFDEPKKASTKVYFEKENEPIEEVLVQTEKSPCLGCHAQSDSENPKIKNMAIFAFEEYSKRLDEKEPAQQFVKVIKAETQVVAGIKYILEVEIGWTNCTKLQFDEEPSNCNLDQTRGTFNCDFHIVEKSWKNSQEVVNADCHKNEDGVESTDYNKKKNYEIISTEESMITENPTTTEFPIKRRKRRVTNNFGSIRNTSESSEVLADIAKFAVDQLDQVDDDNNARLVVHIIKAQKQTVSGWLYHLQIRVAQTACKEGEENSLEKCKDKIILPFAICNVKVLFQPWQTNQKKLTESQCHQEKYKNSKQVTKQLFRQKSRFIKQAGNSGNQIFIGGSKTVDPNSPDIVELTTFAIDSLDETSNAMHTQKLVRVVSAKRQLVAGIRTTLELEVGYTTCRKNRNLDKSKCEIDENRKHQYCSLTIHEKPWMKEKKLIYSKCGKQDSDPDAGPTVTMTSTKRKRGVVILSLGELDSHHEEFGKFIDKYEKSYDTEQEYNYRLDIFKENMKKVEVLQEYEQGTATYGATRFADLTDEEFGKMYLGLRPDLRHNMKQKQAKIPVLTRIPDEFDWRHYNAVTPVKNQGSCGSCWAFSVSGNIEGAYAIKHGSLESFSEQELVDCDTLDEGCNGGLPENAYQFLEKLGGLETEKQYPYEGRDEKCHFNSKFSKAKVTGFVEVSKNETEMASWLLKNGPISIGINANAMQFYFGGVSHPWKFLCSPKNLDHGVLVVGFGVHTTSIRHKTLPYWIIKNSWGPGWGEQGYYRLYRGDGTCGVNQMATSAFIM